MRKVIVLAIHTFLTYIILMSFTGTSYTTEFNTRLFIRQVTTLHLQDESIKTAYDKMNDIDILKHKIHKHIFYDDIFAPYIDEICNNLIGNTMLRLLIANMKAKRIPRITITAGDEDISDGGDIIIDLSNYNQDTGKAESPLCGIDSSDRIVEKYYTIEDTLFHEICHTFHWCSNRQQSDCKLLDDTYPDMEEKFLWTYDHSKDPRYPEDDEELYNITGCYYKESNLTNHMGFDPINCNMYDIYKCFLNKQPIVQRVFHVNYEQYQDVKNLNSLHKIHNFLIGVEVYTVHHLPDLYSKQPIRQAPTKPVPKRTGNKLSIHPSRLPIRNPDKRIIKPKIIIPTTTESLTINVVNIPNYEPTPPKPFSKINKYHLPY
jgi:hypothetical protein